MLPAMKGLQTILDRLLTAPGEARGSSAIERSVPPSRALSTPTPEATGRATVYLLLDISASMDEAKLRQAKDGGLSFAEDAIGKGYAVGIVHFSSWASVRTNPTTSLPPIRSGLSEVGLQATTNMAAAINLAGSKLADRQGPRAIVLVTDGYPDSADSALAAAREAKRHDITIIAIGTHDADDDFLKKLATASGLATTVADSELEVAISSAARLLPARTSSSK